MVENKLMKHVRRLFIFALLFVFTLSLVKVKADEPEPILTNEYIVMNGASIRTTGNPGIRFRANIDNNFDNSNVKKYGILIAFGIVDATPEFVKGGKVNGYDILSVEVSEIDEDGNYFATIYNIPEDSYIQNVTARGYVVLEDDSIIYSEQALYHNLTEVALIASDNEVTGELITSLCNNVERVTLTVDQLYSFSLSNDMFFDEGSYYFYANPNAVVNNNLEYNKKYVCYEYHGYDEYDEYYDIYVLYEKDVTALKNISDSLSFGSTNPKEDFLDTVEIFVMPGTYTGDITISKNNVYYVGVQETYYKHTDTFELDEATQAIIDGKVTITGDNVYIWGFVYKNQVDINGCNNVQLANSVNYASSTNDQSIVISKPSSNISIISLYKADNTPRWVYVLAETENFTMADCEVLDGVTVDIEHNVDMVRFSNNSNYQLAKGIIDIEYNYFRCYQMAFCDRNPAADKYIIFNNYFVGCKTAIQLKSGTNTNAMNYEITANTFNDCGRISGDWYAFEMYTNAKTTVTCNYNVFVDSEFNATTPIIKVYTAEGADYNFENNYFWDSINSDTDDFSATNCCVPNDKTAINLTLWVLDSPKVVIYPLDLYQVSIEYKEVDGVYKPFKYYIAGLNCSYEQEN